MASSIALIKLCARLPNFSFLIKLEIAFLSLSNALSFAFNSGEALISCSSYTMH
jgi:hypothetical protein